MLLTSLKKGCWIISRLLIRALGFKISIFCMREIKFKLAVFRILFNPSTDSILESPILNPSSLNFFAPAGQDSSLGSPKILNIL